MKANKLWNRRFIHLLSLEFVFQFATYMLDPIISGYVMALGASLTVAGFVAGLVATSALAMRPITGWVADKLSKTSLLVAAALLFTVAAFGCALMENVVWLSVFRIVQGIAFAFRSAVVMSLASAVVAHDHVGRAVGWIGVATTVSSATAPSLAAFIGAHAGYRECFVIAGCLFGIGLVLATLFKVLDRGRAPRRSEVPGAEADGRCFPGKGRLRLPRVRDFVFLPAVPYSIMAALTGVPHGINVSLLLTVGEYRGIEGVSLYFALYALAALIMRPLVGRLCDLRGIEKVLAPVVVVELVGVVSLALMHSLPAAALAGALVGVGQGSAYSALQAESVRHARREESGRASNTYYIGPDINMGLSPLIGGFVMQLFGITAMYAVCFVFVASALAVFYLTRKRPNSERAH